MAMRRRRGLTASLLGQSSGGGVPDWEVFDAADQRNAHCLEVDGLADDFDVGLGLQDEAKAEAEHRLVVDQKDPDHGRPSVSRSGCRRAETRHPAD